MASETGGSDGVPILLLKTKSVPGDAYEELFASQTGPPGFRPIFVPVLEHRFSEPGLAIVKPLLEERRVGKAETCSYGGLVFTSQRAVEAFAKVVLDGRDDDEKWPHLQGVPVYSVGSATTRALRAIPQTPTLNVYGEYTGNGDNLAQFILEHYGQLYEDHTEKPPLLFFVGEQRRDVIPKTLMDEALPREKRIQVDEIEVYGTSVMESFKDDFRRVLEETEGYQVRWVVVFSPTGCDAMLDGLGLLDGTTGKAKKPREGSRTTYVATIGPTTRNYLQRVFDFEPDTCSEQPSPEGVLRSISQFMRDLG